MLEFSIYALCFFVSLLSSSLVLSNLVVSKRISIVIIIFSDSRSLLCSDLSVLLVSTVYNSSISSGCFLQ